MSDFEELLSCPFCGGRLFVCEVRPANWKVFCENDCFSMPSRFDVFFTSREQAIEKANKRYSDYDLK